MSPALGVLLRKGLSIASGGASTSLLLNDGAVPTAAGVPVGPEGSLQAVAVYAATSLIAQSIGTLPVEFFAKGDATLTPVQPDLAWALWGDQPNPDQDGASFWESVVLSLLLYGNAYMYPRRNTGGDIREVWPIAPERVTRITRLKAADGSPTGLEYGISQFGNVQNIVGQPVALLHIRALTLPGRVKGLSPISQAAQTIGISLSSEEHSARFLGEGSHMSGTLETPANLNKQDAKDLWDNFQRRHSGPKRAGSVGVLTQGAKFNPLTIPPVELQFIEQQRYTDQKIASLYRVPPHMVGDVARSTSWGSGITEQTKGFVQHTLTPWLVKIERSVAAAFLQGTGLTMTFNLDSLLRGSPKERAEVGRTLFGIGAVSPNEIRLREGMPPIGDEGDRYYVPLNMRPASDEEAALSLRDAAMVMGSLVRAGFDPDDAARIAGMPGIDHLGLPPTTVQILKEGVSDGAP